MAKAVEGTGGGVFLEVVENYLHVVHGNEQDPLPKGEELPEEECPRESKYPRRQGNERRRRTRQNERVLVCERSFECPQLSLNSKVSP